MPAHALIAQAVLEKLEAELASEADEARTELDDAFNRFEQTQPQLAMRIGEVLGRPLDETAIALGYFLSIAVWLAFARTFGARLAEVTSDALKATEDALALEEELRAKQADEPIDLEDVVALAQPGIFAFVHDHVEAALDAPRHAASAEEEAPREVDVDDVHLVYRAIIVMTLALSHAVAPADGAPAGGGELQA